MDKTEVINLFAKYARDPAKKYKYPLSVLVAQAILESGWYKSSLATKYKNLIGMKLGSGKGNFKGSVIYKTREVINNKEVIIDQVFRTYASLGQCFDDLCLRHLRLNVPTGKDYKTTIDNIFKSGYATDPDYKKVLLSIVNTYDLENLKTDQTTDQTKKVLVVGLLGLGLLLILSQK